MKTPEEWLESNRLNGTSFDCAMLHISEIKQIQLDAWKQGMLDAAESIRVSMKNILVQHPNTENNTSTIIYCQTVVDIWKQIETKTSILPC